MRVVKEYKQNNAVYVTMETLQCLYYTYEDAYPKNLQKKILQTLKDLITYIEKDYDHPKDAYSSTHELFERVIYETKQ